MAGLGKKEESGLVRISQKKGNGWTQVFEKRVPIENLGVIFKLAISDVSEGLCVVECHSLSNFSCAC